MECQKTKQQKKYKKRIKKNRRTFGTSMELRTDTINKREEFGYWEIDTVLGNAETSTAFLTVDERKSRKRHIIKIKLKTTEAVGVGINQLKVCMVKILKKVFKSVASDNGSGFAKLNEQFSETT